jgi:tripartite-type tricarboxylate transporter receptor subunit TctC
MLKFIALAVTLRVLCAVGNAAEQNFPTKPVRFVVPFAPGGSTDTLARTIGQKLAEYLGEQVVVDNRPGANGDIGMLLVARAAPDGYTVVLGYIANLGIGPSLYAKMPYDPVRDFVPITQVAGASNILVVHPSVPAKNFKEFAAYTKANPGKVNFASGGERWTSDRRAAQQPGGNRHGARAIQGQRPGDIRPCGRPREGDDQRHGLHAAACEDG